MVGTHLWKAGAIGGGNYLCARDGCDATYLGAQGTCLAPAALAEKIAALLDDAKHVAADLRAARDAAPDGHKSGYRIANIRIEHAIAVLAYAAEVTL